MTGEDSCTLYHKVNLFRKEPTAEDSLPVSVFGKQVPFYALH